MSTLKELLLSINDFLVPLSSILTYPTKFSAVFSTKSTVWPLKYLGRTLPDLNSTKEMVNIKLLLMSMIIFPQDRVTLYIWSLQEFEEPDRFLWSLFLIIHLFLSYKKKRIWLMGSWSPGGGWGGGIPYKKHGGARQKFWKEPLRRQDTVLRAWLEIFFT